MKILFNKYEGTGNDFIIIDNRENIVSQDNAKLINHLCDRRFGIGADGLILVENCKGYDFRMIYFNSDGLEASMCGNGGRCTSHFVMTHFTGQRDLKFMAKDGPHTAKPVGNNLIDLSINDVKSIKTTPDGILVNTGVPHLVVFAENIEAADLLAIARPLRYSPRYAPDGVNVNLVQVSGNSLSVRTYERGVEDETLSCGTGVTASAIAAASSGKVRSDKIDVTVKGGALTVSFKIKGDYASDIHLVGPATFVFSGETEI